MRNTATAGDSLKKRWQPSLCSDPKACSFDDFFCTPKDRNLDISNLAVFKHNHICGYLEMQYHGDLTVDCVESLAFPYDLKSPNRTTEYAIAKKWQQIGVKIYYINNNGDLEVNL